MVKKQFGPFEEGFVLDAMKFGPFEERFVVDAIKDVVASSIQGCAPLRIGWSFLSLRHLLSFRREEGGGMFQ